MKKCFIVSPIGAENSDVRKRTDKVCKYIIEPVCKECQFDPIRADKINNTDTITQTIIDHLNQDELVIADMTDHNPNVFYEMGYRACMGKPMIHLKEKSENIPFDIAAVRAFDYVLTDLDSVDEIKKRVIETIGAINFEENNNSETTLKKDNTLNGSDSLKILPLLYDIQDRIDLLRKDLQAKDSETIKAIINASKPMTPAEDINTTMIKVLMPELIKNPDYFQNLMELTKAINESGLADKRGKK